MILVRSVFHCKPGRVPEFVQRFKDMGESMADQSVLKRSRIMTDLSGPYDTVIVESEIESVDDYFGMMETIFADPDWQATNPATDMLYDSGSRTFYKIEATFEGS